MPRPVLKFLVRLRMWYADIRGHHGMRWDYEPSEHYMGRKKKMTDKIITLLVGLLLALGGWSLSRTFELSTIQAVHEDKVQVLREQVLKLEEQMDKMMDLDEDIMDQHKRLFKILEKGDTPSGSYNY